MGRVVRQAPTTAARREAWAWFGKRERANGEKLTIGSLLRWAHEYDPSWRPPQAPPQGDVFGDGLGCNDLSNAKRFARRHSNELKFDGDRGAWVSWDGKRWEVSSNSQYQAETLAKETASWLSEMMTGDGDAAEHLNKFMSDPKEYMVKMKQAAALHPPSASETCSR